jgi:hypothetical protein
MRTRRYKPPLEAEVAYYRFLSRAVNRERHFTAEGHRSFLELFRRGAALAGIPILTFCPLSRLFHILLRMLKRPENRLA